MGPNFTLFGVVPSRSEGACFATPVFKSQGSNRLWVQGLDHRGVITAFFPALEDEMPSTLTHVKSLTKNAGDEAVYAFVKIDGTIIVGERRAVADSLRHQFDAMDDRPWLSRSVAGFVGDSLLSLIATNRIKGARV